MSGLPRIDYAHRHCTSCLPLTRRGDELHTIIECPSSSQVWHQFLEDFKGQARLLDLPPFAKMPLNDQLATALGNPPPSLLKKDYGIWIERVIPVSSRFAGALRCHLSATKIAHLPSRTGHAGSQCARTPTSTAPDARSNPGGQAILPTPAAGESESSASDDDTACEVCGASDDAPDMLLCDQCDHGYHLYCLSPVCRLACCSAHSALPV